MPVLFRLAVFTDEISQDLERVVQVCRDYSILGVELRALWGKQPHLLDAAQVEEYRKRLDGEGLETVAIASPFYKCPIEDADALAKHHDILRRSIDLAHRLGAPIVRGFTFWRQGAFDEERLRRVADQFEKPIAILEEMDCVLAIENEAACSVGTGRELGQFLQHVEHPRVRSVWDPANSVWVAGSETPFPEGYQAQKPWMIHVHAKDSRLGADGKAVCERMGDGVVDWMGQLRALSADGYSGWVSMETHWRSKPLTQEEIDRPGGASFSGGAEASTRACLDILQEWLGRV